MKALFLGGVIIVGLPGAPLEAKCARMRIKVSGEVAGGLTPDHRVSGVISPDANAKQDQPTIDGNRFMIPLWFDPTRGFGPEGHDCSRDPTTVSVLLTRGERVLQKRELKFDREFYCQ